MFRFHSRHGWLPLAALGTALALAVGGCQDEGVFESAGENVDEAVEDTADTIEDAADDIGDALEDEK